MAVEHETRTAARTKRGSNQRADARRSRAVILEATASTLRSDPDASIGAIAEQAGVSRMTLYAHFANRAELLEAALTDRLEEGDAVLSEVPLDGDPADAFARLIASSWSLLDQARALLAAAQKELPPARIRELHEKAEARMRDLLERGRDEGVFRTDLPVSWLLSTTHVVMHAAAEEVAAHRLDAEHAAETINATLRPALAAPGSPLTFPLGEALE